MAVSLCQSLTYFFFLWQSSSTFSPSTTDDAERDEVLNQKIRIFRWIREEHLDIPHSPHNEAYLNNAQSGECRLIYPEACGFGFRPSPPEPNQSLSLFVFCDPLL